MSDVAGSSGGRGKNNGGRGSGIVIPFYELFGLCNFGSFQVGEDRNTLAILATKAFQKGYDARWGLTMAIPVVLCDLSIRFIWSVRRYFGDKKPLQECIPSEKYPDLRMMLLIGNGSLCFVDAIDAAVRSGGNALTFFLHLILIAWYKLVKRVLAELLIQTQSGRKSWNWHKLFPSNRSASMLLKRGYRRASSGRLEAINCSKTKALKGGERNGTW